MRSTPGFPVAHRLFFLLLFFWTKLLFGQDKQWYAVKAFLPAWNGASIALMIGDQTITADTVRGDMFSYAGPYVQPQEGTLRISRKGQQLSVPFFIETGVIKIRDKGNRLVPFNTPLNDSFLVLQERWDSLIRHQSGGNLMTASELKRRLSTEYIRSRPYSLISLRLLNDQYYRQAAINETEYYELYSLLHSNLQQTATGRKIATEAKDRYATAIGNAVPLIWLPDSSKTSLPVYEKGRFTLIHFWASWCVPCLKEQPLLQSLDKKYGSNLLSITSISIDTNQAAWINAVRRSGLSSKQLSDMKGWASPAVKSFGLKQIPTNFLIDDKGVIIGKNLHLEQVEDLILKNQVKTF